jgi:outer membrane protein
MKHMTLSFLCLIIAGFGIASAQPVTTLSLASYIEIAKKQNPQVRISHSAVISSLAGKKTALSRLLPHVDAQAQVQRSQPLLTSSSASPASTGYSAGVSANQLLFDFGKSWYSNSASSKLVEAARLDEKNNLQMVVQNAGAAYYNYLLTQRLFLVAKDALGQAAAHLELAKVLFETGKQARYMITKAEVDVANATVGVITAKNGLSLAKVQMEVAAGTALGDSLVLTDSLDVREQDISREEALSRAREARPELVASRTRLTVAELQLKSAKMTLFPALSASTGYGYRKTEGFDWQDDWNVGISLSASLYQGGALVAAVDQAKAAVDQARAQIDANTQNVSAEIEQYYLEKMEATERITATRKLIEQTMEGLDLSQQRFAAGAAPSLEVTDAEAALANAKSGNAKALFDYRIAHLKLLAAMGAL